MQGAFVDESNRFPKVFVFSPFGGMVVQLPILGYADRENRRFRLFGARSLQTQIFLRRQKPMALVVVCFGASVIGIFDVYHVRLRVRFYG